MQAQRDPQHAAAPAGRPGAAEDHRPVRRAAAADRRVQRDPGLARAPAHDRRRGAGRDRRQVRRRAAHQDRALRRRHVDGGPDPRGGRRRHDHPRRLRQAHPGRPLPLAAARRQGRARCAAARRRHGRALLHHDDPPLAAVLHQPRPGLPGQGLRAARGRPRRQGPARREPAGVPARRADRPGPGPARLRAASRTWCWPPAGAGEEDPADRVRLQPHRRPDRDQPARGRRGWSARGLAVLARTTCCWSRARGSRCGSPRPTRRCGRWAGRPPASPG